MTLDEKITAAIRRITSGSGLMRIPAEETDPDLVLGACRARIAELEAERVELHQRLEGLAKHAPSTKAGG